MTQQLQVVLDLLRLRAGPQDLPHDLRYTLAVLLLFVVQAVLTTEALAEASGTESEVGNNLLSTALQFVAIATLLFYRRRPERLQQTVLALAATGIALNLLAFPLLLQSDPNQNQPLLLLLWLGLFGWSLAVEGNILRHALDVELPIAMLIVVMLLALSFLALELAFL